MARIDATKVNEWRVMAERTLQGRGFALADVKAGSDAWTIAHKAGITNDAYAMSRDIVDAHIQTALEKIFPNVVFKDAKRY